MRAFVYTRQSSDRGGTGLAVARQREDCLKLVDQRGWTLVGEREDNDLSASGKRKRPGFEATLDESSALPAPVIATVPSVTTYSRTSLLSGGLVKGDSSVEKRNLIVLPRVIQKASARSSRSQS